MTVETAGASPGAGVRNVVIAGAGIGGLTLAHALRRRGIGVRVLERATGPSEIGAGITLWRNALNALESLDLGATVGAVAHAPASGGIGLASGRLLSAVRDGDIPASIKRPLLLTFHRRDLQRALLHSLPDGAVEFGRTVTGFRETTDSVVCQVTGGNEIATDLLVGADGIGSTVRERLLGPQPPRYAGYTCFRGIADALPGTSLTGGEYWGSGDRFGIVPIAGERFYWYAVITAPPRQPVEDVKTHLSRRFARYAWHVPELIEHTPSEAIVHNDILDRPPTATWSGSRVTLLGDAAHATTPNLGQGAAMAIESAVIIARALSESGSLTDALARYEAARHGRTSRVTRTSWRVGRMAHLGPAPARLLRNLLLRVTPASVQLGSLIDLLEYDAATVEPDRGSRVPTGAGLTHDPDEETAS